MTGAFPGRRLAFEDFVLQNVDMQVEKKHNGRRSDVVAT